MCSGGGSLEAITSGDPPSKITFADDFNRADGVLGANWTATGGYTACGISGNKVYGLSGAYSSLYTGAGAISANQFAQSNLVTLGTQGGLVLRGATATQTCYLILCTSVVYIYKFVSGSGSQVGTSQAPPSSVPYWLRAEINGGDIDLKYSIDGDSFTSFYTVTDSSPISGGHVGVYCQGSSYADNFSGGEL